MSARRVAARYAKSLFDLSKEQACLDEINGDMQYFWETCKNNKELLLMLKSPLIPGDKKSDILKSIFADQFHTLSISIFDIIIRKKRESILNEIAKAFFDLYNEEKGIISASITSAYPLNEDLRKDIIHLLSQETNSMITLKEDVDKKLIGGFIIDIEGKQIDTSIKSKLRDLKREFTA
ncbi:MAG: ATP synthase F1 subunit delta [Bacteroidia bacterium]|nr:ATP synthase F1 subunit delta [Bacteroidia bacterium]MBN4052135.1 ATP synthase F1 subunit delta [Sphingobacteriaceae bacterium AH-315-L07]